MKKSRIITIMAMLFAVSVFTFSCKSDDDGGGGGNAGAGTISAKVDGTTVTTIDLTTTASNANGTLIILGNDGNQNPNKAFNLTIVGFDGTGTYPIGGTGNVFNVGTYTETIVDVNNPTNPDVTIYTAPYTGGANVGEIKISEITDTYVKGTFSFKAKNQSGSDFKNITDGSFNVKLNSAQP